MSIERSPEIEAVATRWLDAHANKRNRPLLNMLSRSEHLRYLGTAPGEYWAGSLLRQGLAQHMAEVPYWRADAPSIEGFRSGDVGWATWQGDLTFEGRDNVLDLRVSFVLTLDDGDWRIISTHLSMGYSNLEFSGVEQSAFSELIKAAKAGAQAFGDQESAVIMFTDVANSTELANAMGDRSWAEAIGRQLDMQAAEIIRHEGELVKTLGDGAMASFRVAGGAMRAAAAMQKAAADSEREPRLQLRIGIHAGDLIQTAGDFYGTVVNKASRIADLARPNEILVSDVARSMAGEGGEFDFGDGVSVALRGIEGRHVVATLNWS